MAYAAPHPMHYVFPVLQVYASLSVVVNLYSGDPGTNVAEPLLM